MDERLNSYLDGVFAPYDGVKSATELKADLLSDLQERFRELKAEGKDDETALEMTIDSIGDIEPTIREFAHLSRSLERQIFTNFSARDLTRSDFVGVTAHQGKFEASALRGSNFAGADLTGSSFKASDVREANFDRANLTDCTFSALDLTGASFRHAILVRTTFSHSSLVGLKFTDVKLTDVKLLLCDLRKTGFERCVFSRVDFTSSDLSGLRLDGQTFTDVKFDMAALYGATFKGATLKDVSFDYKRVFFKNLARSVKAASFDGARMDEPTYAALKDLGADLPRVIL